MIWLWVKKHIKKALTHQDDIIIFWDFMNTSIKVSFASNFYWVIPTEIFLGKGQMQGRKKKNRATLLNKFDYYFEQVINEINKFIWKKRVWFCKRNFIVLAKCVTWKIQNFAYQWRWSNLRYHSRRYCQHYQTPG